MSYPCGAIPETDADGWPGPLDRLVGTKFALECEHAETIKDVKAEIEERTGMSRNLQRLLFRGLELQEGCTLSDYNIQKENTLHLVAARSAGSR